MRRGARSPEGTPQRAEAGPGLPAQHGPTPPPRRASVQFFLRRHRGPEPRAAPPARSRSPSPPAASPMRTRRCLRRVSGSLRVSNTFCVDFRTSPCGFLENIPPGPAPAPRSRGGQRPPDPPAPGPYIAGGSAASSSCCCRLRLRRGGARRAGGRRGNSPQARGWPGPDSPLPPSLVLLPLLRDSRQVRPQASLWQPRRDVTAALPGAPPGARRVEAAAVWKTWGRGPPGLLAGGARRGRGGGEREASGSNWGGAVLFGCLKAQYKVM